MADKKKVFDLPQEFRNYFIASFAGRVNNLATEFASRFKCK